MPNACHILDHVDTDSLSNFPHLLFHGSKRSVIYELSAFFAHKIVSRHIHKGISSIKNPHNRKLVEIELASDKKIQFQYIESTYYIEISLMRYGKYMNHIIEDFIKPKMRVPHIMYMKHVFVFHDVEKITNQCMSRLLRIMEKHTNTVLFIFTSTNLSKVISSFRSRCLHVRVPICNTNELTEMSHLLSSHFDMNINMSEEILDNVFNIAKNNFGVCLSIFSCLEMGISLESIEQVLQDKLIDNLIKDILTVKYPREFIEKVRTTYASATMRDYEMSDLCKLVFQTIKPCVSKRKLYRLMDEIAACNHNACMGDRGLFHFEKLMYAVFEICLNYKL